MKKLGLIGVFVLAFALSLVPVTHAANPSITQTSGSVGSGVTSLSLSFTSVAAGDSIVVFEYYGAQTYPSACNAIQAPTDTLGNNWRSLGCTADSTGGAQSIYFVQSSNTGADTVSCNYAPSLGTTESCYAFDVASPNGPASVLVAGTGLNSQVPVSVNANSNSVLLATVGYTFVCHSATYSGQVPSGLLPSPYSPPSECGSPASNSGLTGTSVITGNSGEYQWTMDPVIGGGGGGVTAAWSLVVVQVPGPAATITMTAYTATITGWLVPDAAHFSNALLLIILPLGGLSFGALIPAMFRRKGDIAVYFALGGLTAGSLLADLPANSNNQPAVPLAFVFVAALLTFLYWWNS
jgi:hypothetical protein